MELLSFTCVIIYSCMNARQNVEWCTIYLTSNSTESMCTNFTYFVVDVNVFDIAAMITGKNL